MKTRKYASDKQTLIEISKLITSESEDGEYYRKVTIVNLLLNGAKTSDLSKICGESPRTLSSWVKKVDEGGFEALKPKKQSGRPNKLTEKQKEELKGAIISDPSIFEYNIWNGPTLSEFILNKFDIQLSIRQCQRLYQELWEKFYSIQVEQNTEKWKLNQLGALISRVENRIAETAEGRRYNDRDHSFEFSLFHIIERSFVTTREIIVLCKHGFADGALSLARNLYEQVVIVKYFKKYKETPDFSEVIDDYEMTAYIQLLNNRIEHAKIYAPDEVNSLREERKEFVKKLNHITEENRKRLVNKPEYAWAGKTRLKEIADELCKNDADRGILERLHLYYLEACLMIHANCLGNSIRIGSPKNYHEIDMQTTRTGQYKPLVFSTLALTEIVSIVCKMLRIPYSDFKRGLKELVAYYEDKEKEAEHIDVEGRNQV